MPSTNQKKECLFCVLEEARPGRSAHLKPIDCLPMEGKVEITFGEFHTEAKKILHSRNESLVALADKWVEDANIRDQHGGTGVETAKIIRSDIQEIIRNQE